MMSVIDGYVKVYMPQYGIRGATAMLPTCCAETLHIGDWVTFTRDEHVTRYASASGNSPIGVVLEHPIVGEAAQALEAAWKERHGNDIYLHGEYQSDGEVSDAFAQDIGATVR